MNSGYGYYCGQCTVIVQFNPVLMFIVFHATVFVLAAKWAMYVFDNILVHLYPYRT